MNRLNVTADCRKDFGPSRKTWNVAQAVPGHTTRQEAEPMEHSLRRPGTASSTRSLLSKQTFLFADPHDPVFF